MNKTFWQTNLSNFSALLLVWILFILGCTGKNVNATDTDAPKVERGRLKFSKSVRALNIGLEPVSRDVKQYFFVNGKEWKPENDQELADRINWCDTSPNPKVEILRCFGDATENYRTTYILRMNGEKAEVQKLDEGVGSVWFNDDGRWLLFKKFFFNVETGEKIDIKGMPSADDPDSSAPVQYVIGISPDMKTVVCLFDSMTKKEGKDEFLTLRLIDTETGKFENRKVNFTEYPWLKDHQNPDNDMQPPPSASKKFVWEKDAAGNDSLIVPKLLEKVVMK
jgi:hypothetical protein